jgi:hypothetical protein
MALFCFGNFDGTVNIGDSRFSSAVRADENSTFSFVQLAEYGFVNGEISFAADYTSGENEIFLIYIIHILPIGHSFKFL